MSATVPWYQRQIGTGPFILVIFAVVALCVIICLLFIRTEILLYFTWNNNPLGIRLTLLCGVDPNGRGSLGESPLEVAVHNGNREALETLIEWGADVNQTDEAGSTVLLQAATRGESEAVHYLLEHGADPTRCGLRGTPLHAAAQSGYLSTVTLLVDYGVDVNIRNRDAATPLVLAVMLDHLEVVRYLLDHGADPNAVDNHGLTPLRWALVHVEHADSYPVIELLVARGANVNALDRGGNSLLMAYLNQYDIASAPELEKVVSFLVAQGADPAIRNSEGKTVFQLIDDQITRNGDEERWQRIAALIRRSR